MKHIYKYIFLLSVCFAYTACEECEDLVPQITNDSTDSPFCGWTVTTHYGGKVDPMDNKIVRGNADAFVGAIYDTRQNQGATSGTDWGSTITTQVPSSWTVGNIGQVYGVATDSDNNIFLASSDIYARNVWNGKSLESGNNSRPISCGQIYKCMAPNFDPVPFVELQNNCEALNGIGNIAYDYVNNQLFATNLEDGKIYRISSTGVLIDSYDPWLSDDGSAGIAPLNERIWGIGINVEDGVTKLYFPQTQTSGSNAMYSITLQADGTFPVAGSESVAISNLNGMQQVISDVAFSIDGKRMVYSEYGNIQTSKVWSYENNNGTWASSGADYFVGSNSGVPGGNSAGGVDFGPINDGADASGMCDELVWTTGKKLEAISEPGELAGLQAMAYQGNNQYVFNDPSSNAGTDLFIDLDGYYVDPCDVGSSLIINAGFEDLVNLNDPPDNLAQLYKAQNWVQATDATSDFFFLPDYNGSPVLDNPNPTNGSNGYAGVFYQESNGGNDWVEYIGGCLTSPIQSGENYSFSMLVGAPGVSSFTQSTVTRDLVLLGLPSCSLPFSGTECKEGLFDELDRIALNVNEQTWEMVSSSFLAGSDYDAIMFGLSCNSSSPVTGSEYLLLDDIILTQGQPCTGNEVIKDFPGDVELFKCEGCFGPETINSYINQ